MLKKLVAVAVIAFSAMTITTAPARAVRQDDHKVTICHRTASHTNPYVENTVDKSSVDEINNKYLNGHGDHTGPVWFPGIDGKWGDIIPPFENDDTGTEFPGYNWSEAGRTIYKNDCVPTFVEEAVIVFDVVCAEVENETIVQVTFSNFGDTDGSAWLNGEEVVVPAGDTVNKFVELNTEVKIEINEKVVYQATPDCEEDEGEVLAEEDTPVGPVNAGQGTDTSVSLLGVVVSLAALGTGLRLARKEIA